MLTLIIYNFLIIVMDTWTSISFSGKEAFCHNTDLFSYGDDMTVGSIVRKYINSLIIYVCIRVITIDVLLGHHLTSIKYFSNQYERISSTTSVSILKRYVCMNNTFA